jgi:hypothetical protein
VANRARRHHYETRFPEEYQDEDRWFLLDCDANMQEYPWEIHWPVQVFALALVRGEAPARQWLVYAHAPRGDREGVTLAIPDYGEIRVDVTPGGSFYEVDEETRQVSVVR